MEERRRSSDDDAYNQVAILASQAAEAAKQVAALAANAAVQVGAVAASAAERLAQLAEDTARQVAELARSERDQVALHYPPEHKVFVQLLIDERDDRRGRRKKIQDYIAGAVILAALLGFVAWMGSAAIASFVKILTSAAATK